MEITLKLFAVFRETLGCDQQIIQVELGTTMAQLLDLLVAQYPDLIRWVPVTRFAVNQQFVASDHVLCPGDEVVFIPPVSGG